jgi:hypothetical protein
MPQQPGVRRNSQDLGQRGNNEVLIRAASADVAVWDPSEREGGAPVESVRNRGGYHGSV